MSLVYEKESYDIIGACMEVYNELGKGFSEIVYGDALEIELKKQNILYHREVKFDIVYKVEKLPHYYAADFIIENKIVLELKAIENIDAPHVKQTLNYLAASKLKLGIIVNFGKNSLQHKRVIL